MINRIITLLIFVSISFSQDIFFDNDFEKYAEEEMKWIDEFNTRHFHNPNKKLWNKNPINLTEPYNQAINEGYNFHELFIFLSDDAANKIKPRQWYYHKKKKEVVRSSKEHFKSLVKTLSGRAYILDDNGNLFAQGFIYAGMKRGKWRFYYPPNEDGIQNLYIELHYLQIRPHLLERAETQRFIDETNLQKKRKDINILHNKTYETWNYHAAEFIYFESLDGNFYQYNSDGELILKGSFITKLKYNLDYFMKEPNLRGYSLKDKLFYSTKLNSYYHKSVNYVNNFNQNIIIPDPLKDFETFYSPIFEKVKEQKKQEEQKRRQEEQKREQERQKRLEEDKLLKTNEEPCKVYQYKRQLEAHWRLQYDDRFYKVEVDPPNSDGYVNARVLLWKRSGGLDYKFFRKSCSELNRMYD